FYTSVGLFFNWDETTQRDLISLLRRRNISEIHFVGTIDNPYYNGFLSNSILPLMQSDKKQLDPSNTNLKSKTTRSLSTKGKTQLLLADHLARQIIRLRESSSLVRHISEEAIQVSAFVYDSSDNSFLNTYEIDLQATLLEGICTN
ncbi:unnamed protein product, partial [Ectocarpus sp. 12 AP-2014]